MSEQGNTPGAAQPQATFNLQRIYLKDLSFESPKSPDVFKNKWQPSINLEINTQHSQVEENVYEVVLGITVTTKNQGSEEVSFLIEVQQAGVFQITGMDDNALMRSLGAFCPNLLFPYVREVIDSTATKGNFPPLQLAPVNFEAIYNETLKRRAEGAQPGDQTH